VTTFTAPTREQVSPANQALFDNLKKGLGIVPNLYATLALSEHALGSYVAFQNAKSSLSAKAREVVTAPTVALPSPCEAVGVFVG
jgi:hypothetical protein